MLGARVECGLAMAAALVFDVEWLVQAASEGSPSKLTLIPSPDLRRWTYDSLDRACKENPYA
jgi:hypothetical protein